MTEQQISQLFRAAVDEDPAQASGLVRTGIERGRSLRRRRRVGTTVTAVTVLGVVGLGAGLLQGPQRGAPAGVAANSAPAAPSTSPGVPHPAPDIAVKAREIPALATAVVPGKVAEYKPYGGYLDTGDEGVVANFQLNGMLVTASISPTTTEGAPLARCKAEFPGNGQCVSQADGSVIAVGEPQTGPAEDRGVSSRSVIRFLDGLDIVAVSYNAEAGKDSEVVQPEPGLSVPQLTEFVMSDGWVTTP